jgi:hypothetical protein
MDLICNPGTNTLATNQSNYPVHLAEFVDHGTEVRLTTLLMIRSAGELNPTIHSSCTPINPIQPLGMLGLLIPDNLYRDDVL